MQKVEKNKRAKVKGDPCLIFYHIEKTAGTTFNDVLLREYNAKHVYHLHGSQRQYDIDKFKKLHKSDRVEINCVTGHMSHLLAQDIPKPIRYVTFLRNPLAQVISSYYYQREMKRTKGHERVKHLASISEYLDWQIENRRDNIQTRYLADAVMFMERKTGPVNIQKDGKKYLKKAIQRLDEIELVFITEEFDAALLTMANKLKWHRTPYYNRLNRSPIIKQLSAKEEKRIREVHKFDFELYDEAKKRHIRLIKSQKDLTKRLIHFKKWNRLNAIIIKTAKWVRKLPGGKTTVNLLSKTRDILTNR